MAVSNSNQRRSRFRVYPREDVTMTPTKLRLMTYIGTYRLLTSLQLSRLTELSVKSVCWHMRDCVDAGAVEVVALSRAMLADPGSLCDDLVLGSAPAVYKLTRRGKEILTRHGLDDGIKLFPQTDSRIGLFAAHELLLKDLRIYLTCCCRTSELLSLISWIEGQEAAIVLGSSKSTILKPDSQFKLSVGERTLVAFCEIDMGTESVPRWQEKLKLYSQLYSGEAIRRLTGFRRARVLVITPTEKRRDKLATIIASNVSADIAKHVWLADRSVLATNDLGACTWRLPHSEVLKPLIPRETHAVVVHQDEAAP